MKSFLLILLLLVIQSQAQLCTEPQHTVYMSFPTLSKRDELDRLFKQLNTNFTAINSNYTNTNLNGNFRIINLIPGIYYNDHHQTDIFIDKLTANVSMGSINVGTLFNYTINYEGKNKSGIIRMRGNFDESFYTKKLEQINGSIKWRPDIVPAFTFSHFIYVQDSEPKLTEGEKDTFFKMLNNQAGQVQIKNLITIETNVKFATLLIKYLNLETLLTDTNITYKYKNITIELINIAKKFQLSNDNTKGLEMFCMFGLVNNTENCTKLPTEFDQDQFGGLQQLYTMSTVKSFIKQALSKGLFDVTLDRTWQVPGFQFYMGDLANSIPSANFAPANDPFKVTCTFEKTKAEKQLIIKMNDPHQLYLSVPETCILNYNNTNLVEITFDISLVVTLKGQETSIRAVVDNAGLFDFKWKALDPKYQITSQPIARYSITEVLKGLQKQALFGTNFPIIRRRYPVVHVQEQQIIIFDPSQF